MSGSFARFFGFGRKPAKSHTKPRSRQWRCSLEMLETRTLLYGGGLDSVRQTMASTFEPPAYVSTAIPGNVAASSLGGGITAANTIAKLPVTILAQPIDPRTLDQQMGLPMLDSNPGAPATLYLDFDGNFDADWWHSNDDGSQTHFKNVTTPAFDTDGNAAKFNTTEQSQIKEIWSRVVEDYAPFNINVSTDYYGTFNNGQALHVVIGGSNNDWLKQNASGISSIGSFADAAPNEVFVFNLDPWAKAGDTDGGGAVIQTVPAMATTISHEAGHAFGLRHHALWKVDGTLITDYNPGTSGWTPIMGDNLEADRTVWDSGPTDKGPNTSQLDLSVIGSTANGFGFKADDHGNTPATADALKTSTSIFAPMTGTGIFNSMYDVDAFKFTSGGGQFQVTVNAATFGPNLIPVAELWSANGFVARADAGSMTQSIIHANLPAGTYYVLVKSFGDYGDLGQYSVSVAFPSVTQVSVAMATAATSTPPTTTTTTTSLVTTSAAANAAKHATSLGVGENTMLTDASKGNILAAVTSTFNSKTAKETTGAQANDLIFERGGLESEWTQLKKWARV